MHSLKQVEPDRIKLLVVDDEQGFASVLAKRLSRRGIDAETAHSGTDGIQKVMHNHYDVALVDLKMAGMDGLELLKVLKQMDPHLPVIMLTGHGCEHASREGIELGAHDYLAKPYDLDRLVGKIEAAAGGQEGRLCIN